MVKRRGGRRASNSKGQPSCATKPPPSDESDTTDVSDTASSDKSQQSNCSTPGSASANKNTKLSNTVTLPTSRMNCLVADKTLFVKVVDIQKSVTKETVGFNFNVCSSKQSFSKVQMTKSGQYVTKEAVKDNASVNKNKKVDVGVISRVVTRSRRMGGANDSGIGKISEVGVIKIMKKVSKNIGKLQGSDDIKESSLDRVPTPNTNQVVVGDFKCENVTLADEDDPCISGDIMYEQVIDDGESQPFKDTLSLLQPCSVTELKRPSVIDSSNSSKYTERMTVESETVSQPSSSSDDINISDVNNLQTSNENNLNLNDDTKVSSSSSISDSVACMGVMNLDKLTNDTEISSKSSCLESLICSRQSKNETLKIQCDRDVTIVDADLQNIKALSSLKIDPEVEPVSSSKSESYFEPIFSIDDQSEEHIATEIDSENSSKDSVIKVINRDVDNVSGINVNQNNEMKSSEKMDVSVKPSPKVCSRGTFEKITTRSRSVVNSSNNNKSGDALQAPIINKGKTLKKRTKAELKEMVEFDQIKSSSTVKFTLCNSSNIEKMDVSKEQPEDYLESKKEVADSFCDIGELIHNDVPLIVNRCITDENRKYMGPKGIIKNNYCNPADIPKSAVYQSLTVKDVYSSSNDIHAATEINSNFNLIEEVEIDCADPTLNEKVVPMSPKDLIKKSYSTTMGNRVIVKTVEAGLSEDSPLILKENSAKFETLSMEELLMKNDVDPNTVTTLSNDQMSVAKNINTFGDSNKPVKGLDILEQNVRRSRRNSAEKAKRFISSITGIFKESKEPNESKTHSVLDINAPEAKSDKTNLLVEKPDVLEQKVDKVTPSKYSNKLKNSDKTKKEVITMSSILNEKSKPMSPKELIKKSFSAIESRTMDPSKGDINPQKINRSSSFDDNDNDFDKPKRNSFELSCSSDLSSPMSPKDFKKSEFSADKGKQDFKIENQTTSNSSLMDFDSDKPVKVKSRWRRTSELEMGKIISSEPMDLDSSSRLSFGEDSKHGHMLDTGSNQIKFDDDAIVEQRMNSFIHLDSNEYLTERYISKETKKMVCDCNLTKEEILKDEKGCGEDCLNRLLLIECGSRCPLGKLCSNKSFVNCEYSTCKVVNMASKGVGVISAENIPSDHFIMEYVGEVLDPKEFHRRAKEYSKENNPHFYFMSLKADTVIDATYKGNISRFINHSCDPNAETQKWTVNGELRIGFFSKRPIALGEEITFDYQLQRYGKEAQKCYCGSANCRGWLGEDPEKDEDDDDDENSDEESEESEEEVAGEDAKTDTEMLFDAIEEKPTTLKVKREKKKLPDGRKEVKDPSFNPDGDLEDEIDKLSVTGVKNQKHTLALSRLIVRAGEESSRTRLLELTKAAATPCLRLFLDYHGLNLIWSWMIDPRSSCKLKILIMETLSILPIQNKTILKDSKVLSLIEKWAIGLMGKSSDTKERSSTEEENSNSPREEGEERKGKEGIIRKDFEKKLTDKEENIESSDIVNGDKSTVQVHQDSTSEEAKADCKLEALCIDPELLNQASKLFEDWSNLKEEFRIPRKQRVEQMKEHERQANMGYTDPRENQSYNRRRFRDRKESRFDKLRDGKFDKKTEDWTNWQNQMGRMSKTERRKLFAERVKREERGRREAEELWLSHKEQCKALGVDPTQTAMYHPHLNALAFYHQETNSWQPYQEGAEAFGGGDGGVVVEHHQPPPHYQLDYHQLPPGYYQPGQQALGYQTVFGQFNQALLFQPPPPPPPQQFSIPPPHITPHPLPLQGPPLLQQGPLIPHQGPPLLQAGPPLPHQGPLLPHQVPPIQHLVPPLPHQGLPLPPPSPHLTHQGFPLTHQGPPLPQQPSLLHQPSPRSGLLPHPPGTHPSPILQSSPQSLKSPLLPLPGTPHHHQGTSLSHQGSLIPQQGVYPQAQVPQDSLMNSTEVQHYPKSGVQPQVCSAPLKLPPKWKAAKDKEGRLYYYHVKKRISQWLFPHAAAAAAFNADANSDSSSVDDSSSSSSEEDDDEEEEEEDDYSDLEQENNNLAQNECDDLDPDLDIVPSKKRKSKKDDVDTPQPAKKSKESSLVSTILIPREEAAEIIGITKKKIRDNKEKVKREKAARAARRQLRHQVALQASGLGYSSMAAAVSSKCEADTSSGPKRKIKEIFMLKMANVVVASLNQYRKHDCKIGRITSTRDFKALAKKLTHFIMVKELRHCVNVEDLDCNENVKHKARDFIRKYMSKFGPVYVNPKED